MALGHRPMGILKNNSEGTQSKTYEFQIIDDEQFSIEMIVESDIQVS
tara:strand:- start:39 stop:179 length:141 start_codon:yes stop_codon:yes gene_type:complete